MNTCSVRHRSVGLFQDDVSTVRTGCLGTAICGLYFLCIACPDGRAGLLCIWVGLLRRCWVALFFSFSYVLYYQQKRPIFSYFCSHHTSIYILDHLSAWLNKSRALSTTIILSHPFLSHLLAQDPPMRTLPLTGKIWFKLWVMTVLYLRYLCISAFMMLKII